MFTGIIKTTFKFYKITGNPYKVAYYMPGGSWRVPVAECDQYGVCNGVNSSAGFFDEESAQTFFRSGKPSYAIY